MLEWLRGTPATEVRKELGVSSKTVTDYFAHLRNLIGEMISDADLMIGGVGIEVEIDESKFAKRKYHRGHQVGLSKDWIFGGIEKKLRPGETKKRWFAVKVNNRKRGTLEPIIRQFIREGSIITSDNWKAYDFLGKDFSGYFWKSVNHSKNFTTHPPDTHNNATLFLARLAAFSVSLQLSSTCFLSCVIHEGSEFEIQVLNF